MKNSFDFDKLKRTAMPLSPAIYKQVLPGGKIIGREYVVRNPRRADRSPGSFKINLRTGRWSDFASGDRGGDIISLIAFVENVSQLEAAKLLSRMLGLSAEGARHE